MIKWRNNIKSPKKEHYTKKKVFYQMDMNHFHGGGCYFKFEGEQYWRWFSSKMMMRDGLMHNGFMSFCKVYKIMDKMKRW